MPVRGAHANSDARASHPRRVLRAWLDRGLGARELARDGVALAVGSLVGAVMQTALQVVVARQTTLADFGALATVMVWTNALEMVTTARSGELALQTVGRDLVLSDTARARATAVALERHERHVYGAVYLAAAAIGWLMAGPLGLRQPWYVAGLLLSLPAQAGYGVSKAVFIASGRVREQARFEAAFWAATFVCGAGGTLAAGIPGYIAGLVVANAFKSWLARRRTSALLPRDVRDAEAARHLAEREAAGWGAFGWHSLVRNGLNYLAGQVDLLILSAFAGLEAAAVYKVAKALATMPARASGPLWAAVRPRLLTAWHAADARRVRDLVHAPTVAMAMALVVAAVPTVWFAGDVLAAVYGPRYAAAATPFLWLLAGTLCFHTITGWFGFWVVVAEQAGGGTLVSAVYLGSAALGGLFIGRGSPVHMAAVVAAAAVLASVGAWGLFLRHLRRLGAAGAGRSGG